ncbi:Glycosyltransferase involved in cell wall bisynthesis [Monaibacterium marinum]|uniref:Glycosyltransferase involved in cell wall bisynthesis n=1 Tax=Pontivivens marinum TaxID=1690039 RepID=A0A2C9CMU2_9RHOB|nr:glycosyltransferase family 4 protein [Monaibacterium marinum]SOH92532.1 Glycosyltransferase involved in cell wall bisynthesis [Monaibacterium marinum]
MIGTFAIPGDLTTTSGGYAYDRSLLRELPELVHLALPGGYPFPSQAEIDIAANLLHAADGPLLIDGLAYGALPAELTRSLQQPVVALCHHPLAMETGTGVEDAVRLQASEYAALAAAAAVIVTSETTARTLHTRYDVPEDKIHVAEPGLMPVPAAPRNGSPPVILTVASLTPRKGHDVLIAALAGISDLNWRAIWAGPSPNAAWAETLLDLIAQANLQDRITLLGAISEPDLMQQRLNADLFCLPSHYEGYGMAFTEAMLSGLPVIGCAGGAVTDVVPPVAGLLTEPGDAGALSRSLRAVLTDDILAERLATGGRSHALSLPSWPDTAAVVRDVMNRMTR